MSYIEKALRKAEQLASASKSASQGPLPEKPLVTVREAYDIPQKKERIVNLEG